MKISHLHTLRPDLDRAVLALRNGDVVGMPTETVYGLAASIQSEDGIKKIFDLKERPFFDPLIVHISSFKQAKTLTTDWSDLADYIARKFWPGPLTLVLPKARFINSMITSGLETVGLRMPRHELALELIERLGCPVAAPSANKFSKTSPSRADHVRNSFPDILVIDGGPCEVGLESTVVRVNNEEIEILRPGAITEEQIVLELRKWSQPVRVTRKVSVASPGHLEHHYMPDIPLIIVNEKLDKPTWLEKAEADLKMKFKNANELKLSSDPVIAARELYQNLRLLSESNSDLIFVVKQISQTGGFWEAIWDRLTRAASHDYSN